MPTGPDFLDNLLAIRQVQMAGTPQQLAANVDFANGFTSTTTTDANGVTTTHVSAAVAPVDINASSLISGDITSHWWDLLYPNDVVTTTPAIDTDGAYQDLVHFNRDGQAQGKGQRGHQFVAPPGSTSVTWSVAAKQAPAGAASIVIAITSSDGSSTIASTTCVLTGSLQTFTVTANVTPGTEYRAAIICNSGAATTQAQAYIGIVTLVPIATSGVFASVFNRLVADQTTLLDNSADEYMSRGVFRANPFARLSFDTTATQIAVEYYSNIFTDLPQWSQIGILVNGKPYVALTPTANDAIQVQTVALPAGLKRVDIIGSPTSNPTTTNIEGTFIRAAYVPTATTTLIREKPQGKRLLVYGDSISVGLQSTLAVFQGWAQQLRNGRYRGSVVQEGFGYRTFYQDGNTTPLINALVRRFAESQATDVWLAIGTNDYNHSSWSPTTFGTQYAAFVDALHAAMPGVTIWAQTPITAAIEYPNSLGFTLQNYRDQITTLAGSRSWLKLVDGTKILSQSDLADGLHPTTAGHAKYADFVSGQLTETSYATATGTLLFSTDFTQLGVGGIAAGAGGSTAFETRTGLRLARASAATMQTGPNNVDSTPTTDTARVGQTTASGLYRGLVFEETRTNQVTDARDLTYVGWNGGSYTGTLTSAYTTSPDGTNNGSRVVCTSGQFGPFQSISGVNGTTAIFSRWIRQSAAPAQSAYAWTDTTTHGTLLAPTTGASWVRESLSFTPGSTVPVVLISEEGRSTTGIGGISAGARDSVGDFFQLENGAFATEAIASHAASAQTRASDRLFVQTGSSFVDTGCISFAVTLRPKGSSSQYGANMRLWTVDGNNYCEIDKTTNQLKVVIGGVSQTLATALSWNANDQVSIFVRAGGGQTTYASYTVNGGAKVVIGTATALGTLTIASTLDLLCNGTSNTFTSWVQQISAWNAGKQPIWA